ncbi:MlaA family lipoprotein [Conchiformibius kuhniae]|uniref:VacJ family lipoprotein n=1 Tax=Conchiformibius kuhniae TaxID=211502 RepID=A0A8T9MU85_9NEIS|nr:MlaA family lipoprotein [Conchiformibius kuhniae]
MNRPLIPPRRLAVLLVWCCAVSAAHAAETADPYERYNRAMFRFNEAADRYVMQPVARTYQKVAPQPVRSAVGNFFDNLRDIVSFGSNVLRGNVEKASTDFMRVSVNTTFGLGGLINIADAAKMPNNKNNLGDTFASWGWKNSHYLVMPLTGPSTVRDSLGNAIVEVYSPESVLFPKRAVRGSLGALRGVSKRESLLPFTDGFAHIEGDKYAYTRDLYMRLRNRQVGNTAALPNEDIDIDDLVAPDEGDVEAAPQGETAAPADATADTPSTDDTALPSDAAPDTPQQDAPVVPQPAPADGAAAEFPNHPIEGAEHV